MRRLGLLCWAVLVPALVHAHGRSISWSSWTLGPDGAHVELRLAAIDVTLLGLDPWHDQARIGAYAAEHLTLGAEGTACAPTALPSVREDREGRLVLAWSLGCGSSGQRAIVSRLFADVAPSHVHFARVAAMDGSVAERVLTSEARRWPLGGDAGSTFGDYVALGVAHMRTGFDHLAFVLALLLLAGSLAEVATIVTAFTIAHSVTLAFATLGVVRPDPAAVEALIGFSIALVAA
ncbi:MAG: HupE/UreJ family protein, partial [Candidatus Binatia bacterium]